MSPPNDRKYLATHEWHKQTGDTITIGITQIAADELTDVTFVDLPQVGTELKANQRFGEIESVKATSDLYSGVTGVVAEVNERLKKDPSFVNSDPYVQGWMIRVKASNPSEFEALLSVEDYLKKTGH
jgi:glycine cleavage system H protein